MDRLSYTELVSSRINKELEFCLAGLEVEDLIKNVIQDADTPCKKRKNHYVADHKRKIRVTLNSSTGRMITRDKTDPE